MTRLKPRKKKKKMNMFALTQCYNFISILYAFTNISKQTKILITILIHALEQLSNQKQLSHQMIYMCKKPL